MCKHSLFFLERVTIVMVELTNIRELKGVGEKVQQLFNKINIHTVGDLIRYYPRGYDVYFIK